jgi:hypothetical protein
LWGFFLLEGKIGIYTLFLTSIIRSAIWDRTRYFTDSGIIGSKEFVAENYQRFKHLFHSKHKKKPKPIKGLDGIYSLKRLLEVI